VPATIVSRSILAELEDSAAVDVEGAGRRRHGLGHQRREVVGPEREAAELCDGLLLARVARDLLLGAGPLCDVAGDDEHGFHTFVFATHGDRLDGERQSLAEEVEATALALKCGAVGRERELQDLVGDHAVQLGHEAAPEQLLVEPREPPDRLTVRDQDPQVVIEKEHRRVGQVGGQDPVQLVGAADPDLGRLLCGDVAEGDDAARTRRERQGEDEETTGSTDPSLRRKASPSWTVSWQSWPMSSSASSPSMASPDGFT
jgi:hypothetical protein